MRDDDDLDPYRTKSQKEWADWSGHGYRKLYQPRSVRRIVFICTVVFIAPLLTVFWLAAQGRSL